MMKPVIFLLAAACLVVASCGCPYYVMGSCAAPTSDSVRVEIRERIDTVTATIEVPREVERIVTKDTSSHLENSWAKSDAVVSGGLLSHSLETKPQVKEVPVPVIVRDTTYIEKEAQIIETVVEKPLSWWQRFQIGAGDVALVALAVGILVFIVKKLIRG